ncbi:MAG: hypothetical protein Q4F13_07025 [Pseudomonadota bacterium]|nr:hypothetical protein [Pseudomonadota bacterium]
MLLRIVLIGALLLAPILLSLASQRLAETVGPPELPQDAVNVPLSGVAASEGRAGRARRAPSPARLPRPVFEMPASGENS